MVRFGISLRSILKATDTVVKKLYSNDGSINLIKPYGNSFIESRYVKRADNRISLYLSSHNGCKMNCKFCWLTQQKQTEFKHLSNQDYESQVDLLLTEIASIPQKLPKDHIRININMMARGEPLANKNIINHYSDFYFKMVGQVTSRGYQTVKINLSTIMPHTVKHRSLESIFKFVPVSLYYSMYSLNPEFRKEWIPNGIDPRLALDKIKEYQMQCIDNHVSFPVTFHWTFIEGQNDNQNDVENLIKEIKSRDLIDAKFNLVRYNPHPNQNYQESPNYQELFDMVNSEIDSKETKSDNKIPKLGECSNRTPSRIVERVGYDSYVRCGMFPQDQKINHVM